MDDLTRLARLSPPTGRVEMVLDTDTYNEVDDQFALCYALLSPERMHVQAVYAAPFTNARSTGPEDGMLKSRDEIVRLLNKLDISEKPPVYEGARSYMAADAPVDSPAARDLIERARAIPKGECLYAVSIACPVNIASAILMAPDIADSIVVVWLGGQPHHFPYAREFNLSQDPFATRVLFDSGVPLVQVPCLGVASHLLTSVPEMREAIGGRNAVSDALLELFSAYADDPFAWNKEIWDISTIAWLNHADWLPSTLEHAPMLTDDGHWAFDSRRHLMRVAYFCDRNAIFRDLYAKLANH